MTTSSKQISTLLVNHTMRHRTTILSALLISTTLLGCTDIDIDEQITSGGCCGGGSCPGGTDGGSEDSNAEDSNSEDTKSEDTKSEDTKSEDTKAESSDAGSDTSEPSTGGETTGETSTGGETTGDETAGTTGGGKVCECGEGYTATPAGDECVRESIVEPTQSPTIYNACESAFNGVYGSFGAIVEPMGTAPGGTKESNDYWNGRLNEIGVWACDANSQGATINPIDEWIGFSVCLDIVESGDYIFGIAGDNRVRIDIDGSPVFTLDTSFDVNFKRWHLLPLHLTSGVHVLELRGRNDGGPAAFGAEISGPFVTGSLATDAAVLDEVAYQEKLMWSTGKMAPGQTFQLGEASGWQCPKEAALDVCAPEPVCVDSDHQACG